MEHACLNCQSKTSGKFCANCGQKTETHRITFGHFLLHDLLHGTFHLDRGIIFTVREAITRPGRAALDYIGGKRIRYYNVFYLSLILIGLALIVTHSGENVGMKGGNPGSEKWVEFVSNNKKFILLGFVPLLAINGRLLFKKMKLNLAEHFIVAGFAFVGVLLMAIVMFLLDSVANMTVFTTFIEGVLFVMLLLTFFFPVWPYGNLGWRTFSFLGLVWRMIVFYILILIEIIVLLGLSIWLVTGETGLKIN